MTESEREVEQFHAAWVAAVRRGDLETILGFLAPDYVLWAPGTPPLVGRETMLPMLAAAFAKFAIEPSFECEQRLVTDDLAVERGWDVQTVRPRDGGPAKTQRQRVTLVLRKADGRWQFAWGMAQPEPA